MPEENLKKIGTITHYFPKVGAAVVKLEADLKVGDKIKIKGHGKEFEQTVESMQINRQPIEQATAGQEIGLKVDQPVKEKDEVYKIEE